MALRPSVIKLINLPIQPARNEEMSRDHEIELSPPFCSRNTCFTAWRNINSPYETSRVRPVGIRIWKNPNSWISIVVSFNGWGQRREGSARSIYSVYSTFHLENGEPWGWSVSSWIGQVFIWRLLHLWDFISLSPLGMKCNIICEWVYCVGRLSCI